MSVRSMPPKLESYFSTNRLSFKPINAHEAADWAGCFAGDWLRQFGHPLHDKLTLFAAIW